MTVDSCSKLAMKLLSGLGDRIKHVSGVAELAETLVRVPFESPGDYEVLLAAAWVHDVGYAGELVETGFHHLDGARYLEGLGEHRLACLVAHHSSGTEEATLRGLDRELAPFACEPGLVSDCLSYCDLSVGPTGERTTLESRIAEVTERYGEDSIVSKGLHLAYPRLKASFERVESYR